MVFRSILTRYLERARYIQKGTEFLRFKSAERDLPGHHFQWDIHVLLRCIDHILDDFMMIGRSKQMQTRKTAVCNNNSLLIVLNACEW